MRMMMKATLGLEAGNRAAKDGRLGKIIGTITEKLKPEAAYFTPVHGRRTAMFFFDMTDSAQMPPIAEVLTSARLSVEKPHPETYAAAIADGSARHS